MLDLTAFVTLGVLAVASGFGVFSVNSMARATFLLALSFVFVGGELIVLNLEYLGILTVLMMIIEMAIMVVFMIMFMMNPAGLMPMSMFHNKAGSMAIAVGTFVALAAGIFLVPWPQRPAALPPSDVTRALGESIMGGKMLVMLTVSPVLFAAMVGAVLLATSSGRYSTAGRHDGAGRT